MKALHVFLVLLAGFVAGMAANGSLLGQNATAQGIPNAVVPTPSPRFQIAAWGYQKHPGLGERGCYIVDTITGELWHAAADNKPMKISEKMH